MNYKRVKEIWSNCMIPTR